MKKVLALTAGVLVALAPTGTAFAVDDTRNVDGNAYGNCGHSSKGGQHHTGLLRTDFNKGNGGLVDLAKDEDLGKANGCKEPVPTTPDPVKPVPVYLDFGT